MKNFLTVALSLCLALFFTNTSYGQLSKKEQKEWKKKAKTYKKNPSSLKQVVEDNSNLGAEVSRLNTEIEALKSQIGNKDARISDLQADIQKLRADLVASRKRISELSAQPAPAPVQQGGKLIDGVVFRVQIGAFKNKDLSKYFENHENFNGETDADGTQKYSLGQFRDYWEADTFKKYLREMGVKDAWIVPYRDGTRVEIKDVLEGVTGEEPPAQESTGQDSTGS
ncbi:MAG: Ezrin/radixin/moesin family protein [Cyclobacteriaceae bacterium]|nr:Ezrin/radixin/moesin family protein [Cyclobacteriaceae bacterium]